MVWRNIIALFLFLSFLCSFCGLMPVASTGGLSRFGTFFQRKLKLVLVFKLSVECRGDGCFRPAKSTRARVVCA